MAATVLLRALTLALFSIPIIWSLGGSLDILLFCIFGFIRNWDPFVGFVNFYVDFGSVIDFGKAGATLFAILQIVRYFIGTDESSPVSDDFPAKPMLFPCRTGHTRIFPKHHSFSYSYLLVGIPVGWKGSVGGILSLDYSVTLAPWYKRLLSLKRGSAWYTVNGDDYLARGHLEDGLEGKLREYLHSLNIDHKEYPYAYLLTAPKFLGYSSNPVSIWNLYSREKELKALILEVNNTFDERHIYFLSPEAVSTKSSSPEKTSQPKKLTNTWPKDFYVSVFNSRAGSYSLTAYDPLFPSMRGKGLVNTTITLNSSQLHPKLVARVFSTSAAVDPTTLSVWQKTKFLASWWWVGFATFPRTVVQALILLARKKMKWVFRPEPRRNTLPRYADGTEAFIEPIFRRYLKNIVKNSKHPLVLKYSSAGIVGAKEQMMLSLAAQTGHKGEPLEVEFKVLTPLFYSRFIHYTNDLDGFISECENATISISPPGIFANLIITDSSLSSRHQPLGTGWFDSLLFLALQQLRNRPAPIDNLENPKKEPETSDSNSKNEGSHIEFRFNRLETFLLNEPLPNEQREYASRTLKLFVSEYIAFGWMELLDLEIFLARSRIAWLAVGWLLK